MSSAPAVDETRTCLLAIDEVLAGLIAARTEARRSADPIGAALLATHARRADPPLGPLRGPVPAPVLLDRLGDQFGLDGVERWILAIAAAVELDPGYGQLFGALCGRAWSCAPLDLLDALAPWFGVDRAAVQQRLHPSAPLARWGLVSISGGGSERPIIAAPVAVARWLTDDSRDPRHRTAAGHELERLELSTQAIEDLDAAAAWLNREWSASPLIAVRGPSGAGRHAIAASLLARAGRSWLVVAAGELTDHAACIAASRDARRCDAALLIQAPIANTALTAITVPCVAVHDPDEPLASSERAQLVIGAPTPSGDLRRRIWDRVLPTDRAPDLDPQLLATRYRFGPGRVAEHAARAIVIAAADPAGGPVADRHVRAAVERSRRERGGSLARLIPARARREHLALDVATTRELDLAIAWIRRGSSVLAAAGPALVAAADGGLVCLFHGPSGTGKTLAAEVLGSTVGLDVLRVDIAQVMSKYIGDTEKNLDVVFRDAEDAGAILLFDEADAVFGRRTDVKSSNDRYANVETGFLLQRLEQHRGVVILTTNLERNLDDAFLRRIQIRIEFALPGPAERAAIWLVHLPPGAAVDVPLLARRFALTGGEIRNAVMTALVLAGTDLDTSTVAVAIWREQRKIGRLIDVESFRPWRAALDELAGAPPVRR